MISAAHPDVQKEITNRILMKQVDEDELREICRDPLYQEVISKYNGILVNDISSHDRIRYSPHETQVIGRRVERERAINSYQHDHKFNQFETNLGILNSETGIGFGMPADYLSMAIEVPFDKNIGLKKQARPSYMDGHPPHMTRVSDKTGSSNRTKSRDSAYNRLSSKDKKTIQIQQRKQIQANYTNVDPSYKIRTKLELEARAIEKKVSKDAWAPNKYVIEQIRHKDVKPKTSGYRTKHMLTVESSTERKERPRGTATSKGTSGRGTGSYIPLQPVSTTGVSSTQVSSSIPVLKEMVEIMDLCLQNRKQEQQRRPSITTKDVSTQASEYIAPKQTPTPFKPPTVQPQTQSAPRIHKEPDSYVTIEKVDRQIKTVSRKAKVVKMIERAYELDKDSYEMSELLNNVPSRVYSLPTPIEKELKFVNINEDINAFDVEHFSPQNVEIVDEHMVELERRKISTRVLKDVEIPVIRKIHKLS